MKIAVVIVNYNSGEMLTRCVDKLLQQTLPIDRIVVVDNASQDQSLSHLPTLAALKILHMTHNTGFAAANNTAFKLLADYDYIALLNPDAFPEPGWLENLLSIAQENPTYSFFASRMLMAEQPELLDGAGDVYHLSGLVWRYLHGKPAYSDGGKVTTIFCPCAGAALYRADCLFQSGGFDEQFFCYVEDIDLGFRLQLAGYKGLYVPGAVVHHIGSAVTGKSSDFSIYHGHRNLVWAYVKNMPLPLLLISLPLHIALNLVTIVYFSFRGQAQVILKAKWHALLGLPEILRKRRSIQKQRVVSNGYLWKLLDKGIFKT